MQDRFVGDIGDFGKYGLLRALTGIWPEAEPLLSLAVVWYYREEKGLDYLRKSEEYCTCDEELFSQLNKIVTGSTRTIDAITESRILGSEAVFYNTPVPQGMIQRKDWISAALKFTQESDIVFIDPDNGLSFGDSMSSKHALLSEVGQFSKREQTIIIYQSFWHQNQDEQMAEWTKSIHRLIQPKEQPIIMRFSPHRPRAFIILPAVEHAKPIDERLAEMLKGPWCQYFKILPSSPVVTKKGK